MVYIVYVILIKVLDRHMMKYANLIIILLTICVVVGYAILEKKSYNLAPKKIWTYWDNPAKVPKTVRMCMKGWAKWNPGYEIVLLTKKNFKGYVTIPLRILGNPNFHDNPTRFADLVRIWTLAEHGGIWIDSSTILKQSIDSWLFPHYAEFSGFYINGFTKNPAYPVIENWFFACNKGSPFVRLWRDEFSKIADYANVVEYAKSREKMGVDLQGIDNPVYLAMHVAAQKVLQLDQYPLDSLYLQRAEDGPFRYLVDAKWNSEKALSLACYDSQYQGPIMKMRGNERKVLEEKIEDDLSLEKCGWI